MKNLFTFCFLVFTIIAFGQSRYVRSSGLGNADEIIKIISTSDGGYATVGNSGYIDGEDRDIYFMKLNADAEIEWQRSYGLDHGSEDGTNLIQLPDGGYLISAYHEIGLFDDYRLEILRTFANGDIMWNRLYNHSDFAENNDMIPTGDGGFLVTTTIPEEGAGLLKIDSAGLEEWSRIYHNEGDDYDHLWEVDGITKLSDNTYLYKGKPEFINKIDGSGNVIWSKYYDDITYLKNFLALDEGQFICASVNSVFTGSGYKSKPTITKFDINGNIIWSYMYNFGTTYNSNVSVNKILQTADGGYMIAGWVHPSGYTPYLLRTDSVGNFMWAKTIWDTDGDTYLRSIIHANDEGYMLAGFSPSFIPGLYSFIAKIDEEGNTGCTTDTAIYVNQIAGLGPGIDTSIAVSSGISGKTVTVEMFYPNGIDSIYCGTIETPPCSTAPTGLFADNITHTKAKLHWIAEADAIKYKVQFRMSTSTTWTTVSSTSAVKTITGLTANTLYEYRVRSQCDDGLSSPWSSIHTFTTLPLKEIQEQQTGLHIYPNPNNGNFTIQLPDLNDNDIFISVKNILGEGIYAEQLNSGSAHQIHLPGSISNGMYFVEVKTKDKLYSKQILIAK